MRLTRLTLGGADAHGIGGEDALSRTAAAYRIHPGMYADGGSRSAAGGDQPGLADGDDQLGPVPQAELGQDRADVRLVCYGRGGDISTNRGCR